MRGVLAFRQIAINAAKEAGKVILAGFRKHHQIKSKGKTDVVTEVDKKSQAAIFRTIKKRFPGHSFLSEESPKLEGKSDYLWIIDPLDGTANYSSGIPFFCTSICLAFKKQQILGIVFDPFHNDMFIAEKGSGAFLNGKRIHVSKQINLNKGLIGMDSGHHKRSRTVRKIAGLVDFVRGIRWQGAAALSLSYVACGRLDSYFTMNTNSWDVGAGTLLVNEAGGYVSEVNGKAYALFSKNVLASNKFLHKKILSKIK